MSLEILFKDIKPFVRFSATQHLAVSAPYLKDADVVPYDHRIYFCTKGEGTVFIENEKYVLTPNTILIWRSGLRYRCSKATDSFTCITVNFDFLSQNEEKVTPLAPQGVKYFKPNQIFENNIKFVDNEYFNDVIYLTNITKAENIMSDIVKTFREGFQSRDLACLFSLLVHCC